MQCSTLHTSNFLVSRRSVFGKVRADLFGASFPVTCLVADQQAAVFASGCVRPGDLKLTLGTGAFLDLNTGSHAHGSQKNIYPLVGWKIGPLVCFYLSYVHEYI